VVTEVTEKTKRLYIFCVGARNFLACSGLRIMGIERMKLSVQKGAQTRIEIAGKAMTER